MARELHVAAVQMDANPAPTAERLERAEKLVSEAAGAGADLVVLPEIFNTGYTYDPALVSRAEDPGGRTARWMEGAAHEHDVHVAASFLIHEGGDVYNSLVLAAPDGRRWRYDKIYPWGWERSAFRPSRESTVIAETDLGRMGMLICWDTAHAHLWKEYAGRVDFMLLSSCPVDATAPTFHLPDGRDVDFHEIPLLRGLEGSEDELFGAMLDEQVGWLGVPAVNTVGCGRIRTPIPRGAAVAAPLVPLAPRLARVLGSSSEIEMSTDATPGTKVIDAGGRRVAELGSNDGEAFTHATVTLADAPRAPAKSQPKSRLPKAAYAISDLVLPRLMVPVYEQNVRRAFGVTPRRERMRETFAGVLAGLKG